MIHVGMVALSWALGAFGVAGTVAVIVAVVYLGPATVLAIVQPLLSRFIACMTCVVVVACTLAIVAAYWLGHHQAAVECRAADLAAELRNREIDLANASRARSDETARANTLEKDADDQHHQDLDAIAALKARKHGCPFDDIDAGGGVQPRAGAGGAPAAGKAR